MNKKCKIKQEEILKIERCEIELVRMEIMAEKQYLKN